MTNVLALQGLEVAGLIGGGEHCPSSKSIIIITFRR
jgi:hypothetical protein